MEAFTFRPPENFNFDGPNVSAACNKKWMQRFEMFITASGNGAKNDDVKIAMLISALGEAGFDIYQNFKYKPTVGDVEGEDSKKYAVITQKFSEFCSSRNPVLALRAQFWEYSRPEGQGLDAFLNDLRTMAANCQFEDTDTIIRDKLFFSIKDPGVKIKVMGDDGNASLQTVLQRMRTFESAKRELTMIKSEKQVHAVQSNAPRGRSRGRGRNRYVHQNTRLAPTASSSGQDSSYKPGNTCSRCGTSHS